MSNYTNQFGQRFHRRARRLKKTAKSIRTYRRIIHRSLYRQPSHIRQLYYPSTTTLQVNTQMSYDATTGTLTGPNSSSVGNGFFSIEFQLSDLPQASQMEALWDWYRVKFWKVSFMPIANMYTISVGAAGTSPAAQTCQLMTVIDRDDSTVPSSVNSLLQYDTNRTVMAYHKHTRKFKPIPAYAMFELGSFAGYARPPLTQPNPQLDMASPGINHYGIKGAVVAPAALADTLGPKWIVTCEIWLEVGDVR